MKKYYTIIIISLVTPSIAFASWWNPLSWNIFYFLKTNPQVQMISTTTLVNQISLNNFVNIPTKISTATTVVTTSTSVINVHIPKVIKRTLSSTISASTTTQMPVVQLATSTTSNLGTNSSVNLNQATTSSTAKEDINVNDSPIIVKVTANPINVAYNGSTTISWSSANTTFCTLNSSPVLLTPSGFLISDTLSTSTTYSFICSNGNKSASSMINVNVNPWTPPDGVRVLPAWQCSQSTAPCTTQGGGYSCSKYGCGG